MALVAEQNFAGWQDGMYVSSADMYECLDVKLAFDWWIAKSR